MTDQPNRTDNDLLKRQDRREEGWTESFGKQIADETGNEINIASQYKFSPERVRLFVDGTRSFVQYNSISQLTDENDIWRLQPASGENVALESAESSTYIVGYVLHASLALSVNQSLSDGDVLKFGPYTENDGWFMEQRGTDHTDSQVDIKRLKGGTESTLEENVELPKAVTEWCRYGVDYNWYGNGNQVWVQTRTDSGEQLNEVVAKTSVDGNRSTESGNVNIHYEIEAGSSTTGLELEGGSMSLLTLGQVTSISRDKAQYENVTLPAGDNTWHPILAVRIRPSDDTVNCRLDDVTVLSYSNNADVELVATNVSPDKTDATGWGTPSYHHTQNSALQSTTNISQVPNDSGTQTDLGTDEKFGGYTIGTAQIVTGGATRATAGTDNDATLQKKNILGSDETVFLARSSNSGGDLKFVWDADQFW